MVVKSIRITWWGGVVTLPVSLILNRRAILRHSYAPGATYGSTGVRMSTLISILSCLEDVEYLTSRYRPDVQI